MKASNIVDVLLRLGVGWALDRAGVLHRFELAADLDQVGHHAWRRLWSRIPPYARERYRFEIANEVRRRMVARGISILEPAPILDASGVPIIEFPPEGLLGAP